MDPGISFRNGFYAGLLAAVVIGLYLVSLWQPREQVKLHTLHLFNRIERGDWSGVARFIGGDYQDQWGDDRDRLIERMHLVLAHVRNLRIHPEEILVLTAGNTGRWQAKIKIAADRGEVAALIDERINSLAEPFELEWHHQSWKPWDWKLITVKNPALEIPESTL